MIRTWCITFAFTVGLVVIGCGYARHAAQEARPGTPPRAPAPEVAFRKRLNEPGTGGERDPRTGWGDGTASAVSPEVAAEIRRTMTMGEIRERLGPPHSDTGSGIYILNWRCTDGRILTVSTVDLRNSGKPLRVRFGDTKARRSSACPRLLPTA